jgi:hypothetical protein
VLRVSERPEVEPFSEREALEYGIGEHEDLVRYLESNVLQWKREHIIPQKVADWVGGIDNWEQTVDHFLEKFELLVNSRRSLKEMKRRLAALPDNEETAS